MAVHKIIIYDGEKRYLCNQAVSITAIKSSINWRNVTCVNCLKQKEKYEKK